MTVLERLLKSAEGCPGPGVDRSTPGATIAELKDNYYDIIAGNPLNSTFLSVIQQSEWSVWYDSASASYMIRANT